MASDRAAARAEPERPDEPDGRTVPLTPFAVLGALSAVAGALAAAELLPAGREVALRAASAYLFLAGFALPPLARLAPPRSSLAKLLLFACLLSPVAAGAAWTVLHAWLPAKSALAGTFVLALLLQPSALGRRARAAAPGGAFLAALLLAGLCALLVGLMLLRGSAPRVSYHGLLHASLLEAVDRAVPPSNPWLAGTGVAYYWFWHATGALFARGLALPPTHALALTNVWAALTLPLSLFFLAAPLLRRGAAVVLAVVLGLLGLNLLGGWTWVLGGAPWRAPTSAAELFAVLGAAVPAAEGSEGGLWDYRLAFAFSKLGNLSSYPAALALAAGGLAAAAHAVRHGARPWPLLAALLLGAAWLVNPVVGGATWGAALVATLLFAVPRARARVALALFAGALPGAALVVLAGREVGTSLLELGFDAKRIVGALGPVLPLALAAPFALAGSGGPAPASLEGPERGPDPAERRALLGLLGTAAVLPLALYPFVSLPEANEYKLVRVAALPLAVLAAAGVARGWARGGAPRTLAGAWAALALPGLVALALLGLRSYLAFAAVSLPIEEGPRGLSPVAGPDAGAGAADMRSTYAWLRASSRVPPAEAGAPVLVLDPRQLGPLYGPAPGHAFNAEPNLQGHEAPLFTGLELWCDRRSYLVEHHPLWPRRLAGVEQLYAPGPEWDAAHRADLTGLGRPVVLLVTAADRVRNAAIDAEVEHAGFRPVRRIGGVAVFASPAPFAARLEAAAEGGLPR